MHIASAKYGHLLVLFVQFIRFGEMLHDRCISFKVFGREEWLKATIKAVSTRMQFPIEMVS